jgi:hypothetical protein
MATLQSSVVALTTDAATLRTRVNTLELARNDQYLYRRRTAAAVDTVTVVRFDVQDHGPVLLPGSSTPAITYNAADDTFELSRAGEYLLDASMEALVTGSGSEVDYGWQEQLSGGTWSNLPGSATTGGTGAITRPFAASVFIVPVGSGPRFVRVNVLGGTGFVRWSTGFARVLLLHAFA